jgi:hypothetical protein
MNRKKNKTGFTLVEVLLAVSISIMVFFAMGMLLSKCFSLWKDATANWRLAQYARISRERILSGFTNSVLIGITNQTGLLSATNAVVTSVSGETVLEYGREGELSMYQIRGWAGEADDKHIQMRKGTSAWVYGLSPGSAEPEIKVDSFTAIATNDLVTIVYRLKFFSAGKMFTQWQTITTSLLNQE